MRVTVMVAGVVLLSVAVKELQEIFNTSVVLEEVHSKTRDLGTYYLTRLRLRPTRCIGFSQKVGNWGFSWRSWRALREINPAFRWRCA